MMLYEVQTKHSQILKVFTAWWSGPWIWCSTSSFFLQEPNVPPSYRLVCSVLGLMDIHRLCPKPRTMSIKDILFEIIYINK